MRRRHQSAEDCPFQGICHHRMKRLVVIGIVVLAVVFAMRRFPAKPAESPRPSPTGPVPVHVTETPKGTTDVGGPDGSMYRFDSFRAPARNIRLIANFSTKKKASDVATANRCTRYTNAGFYTTDDTPLGLWRGEGYPSARAITNPLVNGYVWSDGSRMHIGWDEPATSVIAVQTGPVLIAQGKPLPLNIRDDRAARRMVVAVDAGGNTVFFALLGTTSETTGPTLTDLPGIIASAAASIGFTPAWAVNLDGGSASAFKSNTTTIAEWNPVGSLFCVSD